MTDSKDDLSNLVKVFFDNGEIIDAGCETEQIDYFKKISREVAPDKLICTVQKWIWWDLELGEQDAIRLSALNLKAAMIKADCVIDDEAGRFTYGDWVRTSYLKQFHSPCLFETPNTIYLLVGAGTRKKISLENAKRFF